MNYLRQFPCRRIFHVSIAFIIHFERSGCANWGWNVCGRIHKWRAAQKGQAAGNKRCADSNNRCQRRMVCVMDRSGSYLSGEPDPCSSASFARKARDVGHRGHAQMHFLKATCCHSRLNVSGVHNIMGFLSHEDQLRWVCRMRHNPGSTERPSIFAFSAYVSAFL